MTKKKKTFRPQTRYFFFKNFFILVLSVLIPLVALERIIFTVVRENIYHAVNTNNANLLMQSTNIIEAIVTDLEYLTLSIEENPTIFGAIEAIVHQAADGPDEGERKKLIADFLNPVYLAKPYIASVYVYLENDKNRFVAGGDGGFYIDEYDDLSWYWYYALNRRFEKKEFWSKRRLAKNQSAENGNMELITLSRPFRKGSGELMLNIRKEYLDAKMENLIYYRDQKIIVLDENNETMFLSHPKTPLLTSDIETILSYRQPVIQNYSLNGEICHINIVSSAITGWTYLSAIPNSSLFILRNQIGLFINTMFILAILVCLALSFFNTLRLTHNLASISKLLELARRGVVPQINKRRFSNEYDQLVQDMLEIFISQNSLKQQLTEKKHQARILEISALHSQISPHFLFNTLQSIFWMSVQQNGSHNPVCEMIENMSIILDYILNDEETLIPIKKEIDMAKNYIAIQKMRHETMIEVNWDYEEGINPYNSIKLLLQPLLENSIIHGIKRQPGFALRINVRFVDKGDEILAVVADNGTGIPREKLDEIRLLLNSESDEGHIGIYNLNRRLILTFGEKYGLAIESEENLGTKIYIRFPKLS